MKLCSNRPEGFGPHSILSSPIPTTCFVDTILVPLPIWLALAILPVLFLAAHRRRKVDYDPSTAHIRSRSQRSWAYNITALIYYVLIICNILMQTLEIVRLELIHYGISLLPFVYVGLLIGGALHWSHGIQGRVRGWQGVNGILWIGGLVMTIVKVVGLNNEGINGRKGSKYPISDQVTDVAVMAGVYAVIAILELILGVWRIKRAGSEVKSEKSESAAQEGQAWDQK